MPEKLTTRAFIEKARAVHGERYGYEQAVYTTARKKVSIICPVHGEFEQTAFGHMAGHGCPKCCKENWPSICLKDTNWFKEKAKSVHGDAYDYSESVYKGSQFRINIICPQHGLFTERASQHLSGHGCKKCLNPPIDTAKFIEKARTIHGESYDYSLTVYSRSNSHVTIICPVHGEFKQTPSGHTIGKYGCKQCGHDLLAARGYDKSLRRIWIDGQNGRKAVLYIIELRGNGETFYKVGVTFNLAKRLSSTRVPYSWRTIATCKSYDATKIYDLEQRLHQEFKHLNYSPLIDFHGRTECFSSVASILPVLPPDTFFLKNRTVV